MQIMETEENDDIDPNRKPIIQWATAIWKNILPNKSFSELFAGKIRGRKICLVVPKMTVGTWDHIEEKLST